MPVASGNNLYCAGYVETAPVDTSYEIVGAQNEKDGHIYAQGDYLYMSFGANRGAKIGDVYSVIDRADKLKRVGRINRIWVFTYRKSARSN